MGISEPCTLPPRRALERERYYPSGERVYTEQELDWFDQVRPHLNAIEDVEERREQGRELLHAIWPDTKTFVEKQHRINTKKPGATTMLQWNFVQRGFYTIADEQLAKGVPTRIITLKARQLGQSTGIQSWNFHQCDVHANRVAMTISYDDESTIEMFQKAHRILKWQWFPPRTTRARGTKLELENGSTFLTATAGNVDAGRSFTYHHLHISELPMWSNAAEVLDGLMQSVPDEPETSVFIESTAKGTANEFHAMWEAAEKGDSDFVPYFAPWFWDPSYADEMAPADERSFKRRMKPADEKYMEQFGLTIGQMKWRERKIRTELRGSVQMFDQEYPASPELAFVATGNPAFNQYAIKELANNVCPPRWRGEIIPKNVIA